MDLDSLQNWVEALYYNVKVKEEIAEYQAYLLDEITRPWPFDRTPQSVQDSYKTELQKQRIRDEEVSKQSEFDKELKTVENILLKARLLHEKETKVPKSKKSFENPDFQDAKPKIPQNVASNAKTDPKKLPQSNPAHRTKNFTARNPVTANFTKRQQKSTEFRKGPSKLSSAGTQRGVKSNSTENSRSGSRHIKSTSSSDRKTTNSPQGSPKETRKNGSTGSQTRGQAPLPTAGCLTKEKVDAALKRVKQDIEIDFSKIKLNFNDVKEKLELPQRTKKLLSTHAKLKAQICDVFAEKECQEEITFATNMHQMEHRTPHRHKSTRTLISVNYEMCQCLRTCTNAVSVIRGLGTRSKGSGRQHVELAVCLASGMLEIVEELYSSLLEKYQKFSDVEIVHLGSCSNGAFKFGGEFLLQLPLKDLSGMMDDLPYPTSTLTYQNAKEVADWTCKRLQHQFLLIERNLLREVSDSYFRLIDQMVNSENGDVPSPELVHLLQNAYGLLANEHILLPAYVVAE